MNNFSIRLDDSVDGYQRVFYKEFGCNQKIQPSKHWIRMG